MKIEAPLRIYTDTVRPEWIDYNGHMNVAYYVLAFDYATDALFDHLGIGLAYKESSGCSTFAADMNIGYRREVHMGDPLSFATWLLGHDDKRLHYYHEMYHGAEGWLAATCELLSLHIDMVRRRTAPFPDAVIERLKVVRAAHAALPVPEGVGREIRAPRG
jgi:acyl-CoA thioester hydrolase